MSASGWLFLREKFSQSGLANSWHQAQEAGEGEGVSHHAKRSVFWWPFLWTVLAHPCFWSGNLNFGKRARCCVRHLLFIFHEQICSTWSHYKSWRKAKKSRLACGHQAAYPPCQGAHLANWWAKVLVAIGGSCGSAQAGTEWSGPLATLDLHSKNRASLTLMQRGKSWLADISGLLHGDVWLAGFYSLANEQQGCQYSMIWWDFCLFVIW